VGRLILPAEVGFYRTVTFTGCEATPFATTTSVLAPVPIVDGTSNIVETFRFDATPMNVVPCVRQ
jgi:hypothetical protein